VCVRIHLILNALLRERGSCLHNVFEGGKSSWLHEISVTQTVFSERRTLGESGKTAFFIIYDCTFTVYSSQHDRLYVYVFALHLLTHAVEAH